MTSTLECRGLARSSAADDHVFLTPTDRDKLEADLKAVRDDLNRDELGAQLQQMLRNQPCCVQNSLFSFASGEYQRSYLNVTGQLRRFADAAQELQEIKCSEESKELLRLLNDLKKSDLCALERRAKTIDSDANFLILCLQKRDFASIDRFANQLSLNASRFSEKFAALRPLIRQVAEKLKSLKETARCGKEDSLRLRKETEDRKNWWFAFFSRLNRYIFLVASGAAVCGTSLALGGHTYNKFVLIPGSTSATSVANAASTEAAKTAQQLAESQAKKVALAAAAEGVTGTSHVAGAALGGATVASLAAASGEALPAATAAPFLAGAALCGASSPATSGGKLVVRHVARVALSAGKRVAPAVAPVAGKLAATSGTAVSASVPLIFLALGSGWLIHRIIVAAKEHASNADRGAKSRAARAAAYSVAVAEVAKAKATYASASVAEAAATSSANAASSLVTTTASGIVNASVCTLAASLIIALTFIGSANRIILKRWLGRLWEKEIESHQAAADGFAAMERELDGYVEHLGALLEKSTKLQECVDLLRETLHEMRDEAVEAHERGEPEGPVAELDCVQRVASLEVLVTKLQEDTANVVHAVQHFQPDLAALPDTHDELADVSSLGEAVILDPFEPSSFETVCRATDSNVSEEWEWANTVTVAPLGASFSSADSFASAPQQNTPAQCYLPRTAFKLPLGRGGLGRITAAELKGGRDVVLGANDNEVRVLRAERHPEVERDIVYIYTNGNGYPFQVTKDHRLFVEAASGCLVTTDSGSLFADVEKRNLKRRIFDGVQFQDVLRCEQRVVKTEVVAVTFEDDAPVPAWLLPKRAKSARPPLKQTAAVTTLGSRLGMQDRIYQGQELRRDGFIHITDVDQIQRSHSTPATIFRGPERIHSRSPSRRTAHTVAEPCMSFELV